MHTSLRLQLLIALMALPLSLVAQIVVDEPIPVTATIRVNAAASAGADIPRTIFGTFLEPIGDSTYNGLWAEILENPSFESGLWDAPQIARMLREEPSLARASQLGLPLPWEPLRPGEGNRYEVLDGDAANSWQSLVVYGIPGQPTGIRQRIYLPAQRTLVYRGSLYARHLSGPDDLTISIRAHDSGEVLASAQVAASSPAWTKYTFALTLPAGKLHRLDPADFAVEVEGDERVDLDEFSLMPADALDGLDPDVVAMAKAMHTSLLRFGGNFTSAYDWRNGIGPRDKRVSMRNLAWGIPEYNTFGTDEFLHFCRLIGAEPQIALNLGGGTPQEAAAWVRYVDQHWHQHSGLLWELGNELWGNWNLGYPTLDQLAGRTLAFSQAVRQIDPGARLIATGEDPDDFTQWNAVQLGNPAGTFNYLSTHFVVTTSAVDNMHASDQFIDEAAFALPVELGRKLQQEQDQIDSYPSFARKAQVAFTEWLFVGPRPGTPNFTNMGGAVDTAGFLNMLMGHAGIVPISDMTGIMDFAGIWKSRGQVYAAPGYYAFRMYSTADVVHPVQVVTRSGSYSVIHGVSRLPDIPNVPYLDIVAATSADGRTLDLFCVNRSTSTDIPANITPEHFAPDGVAQIQNLRAGYLDEGNDADDPTRVIPQKATQALEGPVLHYVFPHESVTVIAFHRAQ
ncbi:MAG TPA: alpha-L-arabinofuranosidase C-terminal domain-containing protein [Acidobacteriaceae bacterium]|nr:alpha-L-arabinofuranosidase C-terminal domain-containing protein [Acidobacteriaceae bacterium]